MGSDGSFIINNGLFGRPVRPDRVLAYFLFVVELEYTSIGFYLFLVTAKSDVGDRIRNFVANIDAVRVGLSDTDRESGVSYTV